MNIREPPKPAAILATPLNVEESRAQRLQRSQARFRDRGGIFVPSSRNKLAEILLGKASPLKKPRRSISASPTPHPRISAHGAAKHTKHRSNDATRRSPRKKPRKSTHAGRDVGSEDRNDVDGGPPKITSTKVSKATSKGKAKPRKKAPAAPSEDEDVQSETNTAPSKKSSKVAPRKTTKRDVPTSSKGPSKVSKPSKKSKDAGEGGDGEGRPKSKAKKPTARSKPIFEARPPVFTSTVTTQTISKAQAAPTSSTMLSSNKPQSTQRRKSSQFDSDSSEDEYVPSKGTQKDVEELRKVRAAKAAARAKAKAKAQASGKSASISGPSSSKSNAPRPPPKPPVTAPPEKSRPGAPQLSAIIEEDEEEEVPDELPSKQTSTKGKSKEKEKASASRATSSSSSSSKKRHADEADLDVESSSKSKRSKPTSSKESIKVSKKRPRPTEPNEDDAEDDADDGADASGTTKKPAKRKKTKSEDEEVEEQRQPLKKLPASKPPKPKSSSSGKGEGKDKPRSAPRRHTKTVKRKENSVGPPFEAPIAPTAKVASQQRGPPKSVLLRIQQNAKLEDADNDPDPIDFLS